MAKNLIALNDQNLIYVIKEKIFNSSKNGTPWISSLTKDSEQSKYKSLILKYDGKDVLPQNNWFSIYTISKNSLCFKGSSLGSVRCPNVNNCCNDINKQIGWNTGALDLFHCYTIKYLAGYETASLYVSKSQGKARNLDKGHPNNLPCMIEFLENINVFNLTDRITRTNIHVAITYLSVHNPLFFQSMRDTLLHCISNERYHLRHSTRTDENNESFVKAIMNRMFVNSTYFSCYFWFLWLIAYGPQSIADEVVLPPPGSEKNYLDALFHRYKTHQIEYEFRQCKFNVKIEGQIYNTNFYDGILKPYEEKVKNAPGEIGRTSFDNVDEVIGYILSYFCSVINIKGISEEMAGIAITNGLFGRYHSYYHGDTNWHAELGISTFYDLKKRNNQKNSPSQIWNMLPTFNSVIFYMALEEIFTGPKKRWEQLEWYRQYREFIAFDENYAIHDNNYNNLIIPPSFREQKKKWIDLIIEQFIKSEPFILSQDADTKVVYDKLKMFATKYNYLYLSTVLGITKKWDDLRTRTIVESVINCRDDDFKLIQYISPDVFNEKQGTRPKERGLGFYVDWQCTPFTLAFNDLKLLHNHIKDKYGKEQSKMFNLFHSNFICALSSYYEMNGEKSVRSFKFFIDFLFTHTITNTPEGNYLRNYLQHFIQKNISRNLHNPVDFWNYFLEDYKIIQQNMEIQKEFITGLINISGINNQQYFKNLIDNHHPPCYEQMDVS